MPKRTRANDDIDVNNIAESINMDRGLIDRLLLIDHDELSVLLTYIDNKAKIPNALIKEASIALKSFSATKWFEFAQKFGLSQDLEMLDIWLDLKTSRTPKYSLPPSLHEAMFENAWHWQDVYCEKVNEIMEASVRILDPYLVPIVALFQGRVIDKPEQAMMETKYSTGGDVDHEIFMIGGILFLIIKFKRMPRAIALAQLFLELASAAEVNKSTDFKGLCVYGLLTNFLYFNFYSFDPSTNQFCFDETIITNVQRTTVFAEMMNVSNKIFGVILSAYVDGLRASITQSKDRAKSINPSELTSGGKDISNHKSTDQWEAALALAESCRFKFEEPVSSHQDIEDRANKALGLLTQSVRSIPRASTFTGGVDDPSTSAELQALANRISKETHARYLSELKQ